MPVTATRAIDGDPDAVFALITDPQRLPTWNRIMQRTVQAPEKITPGAHWTVEFRALGQTWRSVSTATAIDRDARHFAYRAATDDGNPSYADWDWTITPGQSGCVVAVSADLHPVTFWRRVLLAKIRARQLSRELPDSLDDLAEAVVASSTS